MVQSENCCGCLCAEPAAEVCIEESAAGRARTPSLRQQGALQPSGVEQRVLKGKTASSPDLCSSLALRRAQSDVIRGIWLSIGIIITANTHTDGFNNGQNESSCVSAASRHRLPHSNKPTRSHFARLPFRPPPTLVVEGKAQQRKGLGDRSCARVGGARAARVVAGGSRRHRRWKPKYAAQTAL